MIYRIIFWVKSHNLIAVLIELKNIYIYKNIISIQNSKYFFIKIVVDLFIWFASLFRDIQTAIFDIDRLLVGEKLR